MVGFSYYKCKKLKSHGLQGFEWRYLKGRTVYVNDSVYVVSEHKKHDGLPEMYSAKNSKSITKQEYQEATGDYTCDDVEFLSEPNNETYTDADWFNAKLDRIPFEIAAALTLFLMVVLLCTN